jgi:uncharacterized membrane protein
MLEEYLWMIPLAMMALCFFMMVGRKGSMMCGSGSHGKNHQVRTAGSAIDILDKRFALGEIDRKEYEEAKRALKNSDRS